MLAYADVCSRMLTYADVCGRMRTYADVGRTPLSVGTDAGEGEQRESEDMLVFLRMPTYADVS